MAENPALTHISVLAVINIWIGELQINLHALILRKPHKFFHVLAI